MITFIVLWLLFGFVYGVLYIKFNPENVYVDNIVFLSWVTIFGPIIFLLSVILYITDFISN